jgi:hypothetical protein
MSTTGTPTFVKPYLVVVTREGKNWLADVPQLEGASTFSRTLSGLERSTREVIVLADGLSDDALENIKLDLQFHTGDSSIDETAFRVRRLREDAESLNAMASSATAEAVFALLRKGHSVHDTSTILGISPQRVSQLKQKADFSEHVKAS